jgi:hypothetical protein
MKKLYFLSILSALSLACNKSDIIEGISYSNNNSTPVHIVPASSVSMKLNDQEISFTKITKERSRTGKYFRFSAENDSLKIELKIKSINQTGNTTGLILVGEFGWKLFYKNPEGGYAEHITTDQWLGLYSDMPLTAETVSGEFWFKAQVPGTSALNVITAGKFRLLF